MCHIRTHTHITIWQRLRQLHHKQWVWLDLGLVPRLVLVRVQALVVAAAAEYVRVALTVYASAAETMVQMSAVKWIILSVCIMNECQYQFLFQLFRRHHNYIPKMKLNRLTQQVHNTQNWSPQWGEASSSVHFFLSIKWQEKHSQKKFAICFFFFFHFSFCLICMIPNSIAVLNRVSCSSNLFYVIQNSIKRWICWVSFARNKYDDRPHIHRKQNAFSH